MSQNYSNIDEFLADRKIRKEDFEQKGGSHLEMPFEKIMTQEETIRTKKVSKSKDFLILYSLWIDFLFLKTITRGLE